MPSSELPPLFLASQSPRRRILLESLGLPFSVIEPQDDEKQPTHDTIEAVIQENAARKAQSILQRPELKAGIAIGADTLVVVDKKVLGKPTSAEHGKQMLRSLSGRPHSVYTGLALISKEHGNRTSFVHSRVHFRPLTEGEIDNYFKTKEPYDKAGAYAIQGMGALFIERIEGSYTNIMGFPIERFLEELASLSKVPLWHWFAP